MEFGVYFILGTALPSFSCGGSSFVGEEMHDESRIVRGKDVGKGRGFDSLYIRRGGRMGWGGYIWCGYVNERDSSAPFPSCQVQVQVKFRALW